MSETIRLERLDKVVLDKICDYVLYNGDLRRFASVCTAIRKFIKEVYLQQLKIPDGYKLCADHYRIEKKYFAEIKCTHCLFYSCRYDVTVCYCQKCIHANIYTYNHKYELVNKHGGKYNICINCRSTCPGCKNPKPITQKYCGKKKCCSHIRNNFQKNIWHTF